MEGYIWDKDRYRDKYYLYINSRMVASVKNKEIKFNHYGISSEELLFSDSEAMWCEKFIEELRNL